MFVAKTRTAFEGLCWRWNYTGEVKLLSYVPVFLNPHKMCVAHTTSDIYCKSHFGTALSAVVKTVFNQATPTAHLTICDRL